MGKVNKNQLAGQRGAVRSKFFAPDSDCLPRFNYSNGAGWRIKNKGKLHFKIRRLGEGRVKHNVDTN